jgi:hypothetical protein
MTDFWKVGGSFFLCLFSEPCNLVDNFFPLCWFVAFGYNGHKCYLIFGPLLSIITENEVHLVLCKLHLFMCCVIFFSNLFTFAFNHGSGICMLVCFLLGFILILLQHKSECGIHVWCSLSVSYYQCNQCCSFKWLVHPECSQCCLCVCVCVVYWCLAWTVTSIALTLGTGISAFWAVFTFGGQWSSFNHTWFIGP